MGQAFLVASRGRVLGGAQGCQGWAGECVPVLAGLRQGSPSMPAGLVPSGVSCFRPSQPLLDRSIPDFTAFTSVDDWLSAVKMSQYRDSFLTAGFTSLQLVAQMTSE